MIFHFWVLGLCVLPAIANKNNDYTEVIQESAVAILAAAANRIKSH